MFKIFIFEEINKKCIAIIFELFILYNSHFSHITSPSSEKNKRKTRIFTFWEPRQKIPGYIQLCLNTWKKFLPEYEIIILDYHLTKQYIGNELFSNIICRNMTLQMQADAIRVAILYKYGGIWMDADTILLSGNFLKKLKNYDLAMIGDDRIKQQDIGFIYSSNNSSLIKMWLKEIIIKIKKYKKIINAKNKTHCSKLSKKKYITWSYLGNGIINKFLKNTTGKNFYRINRNKLKIYPERKFYRNSTFRNCIKYRLFYFRKRDPQIVLNETRDIILLHNSWTPRKYKKMSITEFLNEDILLTKLLEKILNKDIKLFNFLIL